MAAFAVGCASGSRPGQEDAWITGASDPGWSASDGGDDQSDDGPGPNDPVDERPAVRADPPPPPIMGGTLHVMRDGALAVAADPARDTVHIVDLDSGAEVGTVELLVGERPFRIAEDGNGLLHVALRGSGTVAVIDPAVGQVTERHEACANPRGVAFEAASGLIHVACAGGWLVSYAPGDGTLSRVYVAPDLRDVLVVDGELWVTRFRSAEALRLDADRAPVDLRSPASIETDAGLEGPGTAWRTIAVGDGRWAMLHQVALNDELPSAPRPGAQYYGGSGCSPVVDPVVTLGGTGDLMGSGQIAGTVLAVDAAASPDGDTIALAVAGQSDEDSGLQATQRQVLLLSVAGDFAMEPVPCRPPHKPPVPVPSTVQPTAVAFHPAGDLLVLSREPPALLRVRFDAGSVETIELAGDSVFDSAHDLFHQDAGAAIACASCHPEGGDDGHVWSFEELGARRTQALDAGLEGTAPFHWDGELRDMTHLISQVHVGRMGGIHQSAERIEALRDWLFAIPTPNPLRDSTDEAVVRGEARFKALACASCHAGDRLTNNESVPIEGVETPLQVPSLHGVAVRPPFMHDARARTLDLAVKDMLKLAPDATADDIPDLVAYLESL